MFDVNTRHLSLPFAELLFTIGLNTNKTEVMRILYIEISNITDLFNVINTWPVMV